MGRVLGIDLGTTNSCVAVVESGTPLVVPTDRGNYMLPSVVAFSGDGTHLVGRPARRQSLLNPEHTVVAAKRMMGLTFDDPRVQTALGQVPYRCCRGSGGDVRINAHGRDYAIAEIAAFVLAELKRCAEDHFNESFGQAVITVPAYFNDFQRQATRDAGRIAGLEVLRILNEPTAAALAYGALEQQKRGHIVVYDLGGGTFDVSVLQLGDGAVEVRATAGDAFLGGRDFDHRLYEWLNTRIESEHGVSLRSDKAAMQRLWEIAEATKIDLSEHVASKITLPFLAQRADGTPVHVDFSIERDTFEKLVVDLVERTMSLFTSTIAAAGLAPGDIDEVLLVGGMTRMPRVQQLVGEVIGRAPSSGVHPDLVVAVGAAIQGELLREKKNDALLLDVTPHNLGIMSVSGLAETIIPKDTRIPTEAKRTFTTASDGQDTVRIVVYQGDSRRIRDNQVLGEFTLSDLPVGPRGAVHVEVTFAIGADGIVSVSAVDPDSGRAQAISIEGSHTLPEDELLRMVANHREQLLASLGD